MRVDHLNALRLAVCHLAHHMSPARTCSRVLAISASRISYGYNMQSSNFPLLQIARQAVLQP
jgi:hypothetical protein